MKRLVKTILIVTLFCVTNTIEAQGASNYNITRSLEIDKLSKTKEISVEANKRSNILMISVTCNIEYGSVTIELYDPKGAKKGNLSVESISNEKGTSKKRGEENYIYEHVSGKIDKTFPKPLAGKWKIKIIPKNASGHINISSNQDS